jgi:WD40 repeat protein
VTALAFSDDGNLLLSGGEDTVACAWLLSDVLDGLPEPTSGGAALAAAPFQSWCCTPAASLTL